MTSWKKRLVIWLFAILAIGGFFTVSVRIMSTKAERAASNIKLGMTYQQVLAIPGCEHPEVEDDWAHKGVSLFCRYGWDDGSLLLVSFHNDGKDMRVILPPLAGMDESPNPLPRQDKPWEKARRYVKQIWCRLF
jgi:hypothetical protein